MLKSRDDQTLTNEFGTFTKIFDGEIFCLTNAKNDNDRVKDIGDRIRWNLSEHRFEFKRDEYMMKLIHIKKLNDLYEMKYHLKIYRGKDEE